MTRRERAPDPAPLLDPDAIAADPPHALWARMRAFGDPVWTPEADGPGFWSLTRHDHAARLLSDAQTFSVEDGTTLEGDRWRSDPAGGRILGLTDPPRHTRLRRALAPHFAGKRLATLAAEAERQALSHVRTCLEHGSVEFVDAVANRLPVALFFSLLGIDEVRWEELFETILQTLSPDETERFMADAELLTQLAALAEDRRRAPGEDLLSTIVAAVDGEPELTPEDAALNFAHVIAAGVTTTRLGLSAAVHHLAAQPDGWRALAEAPDRVARAVEEAVRLEPPPLVILRKAQRHILLGDVEIAPGERAAAWLPAANRDPDAFEAPDVLSLEPRASRHLGFGKGAHACIGRAVARLEMTAFLQAAARAWAPPEPTGPPQRMRSLVLQGIEALPIAVRPAR